MTFIHIMNTRFGKIDEYGARSRYIAEMIERENRGFFFIVAKDSVVNHGLENGSIYVKKAGLSVYHQFVRYFLSAMKLKTLQKKILWSVFDRKVSSIISKVDLSESKIFHTWEWVPESIKTAKRKNSNIKIVRDVVINRYYEYFSGTPIVDENELVDYFFSPSGFSTGKLIEWGIPVEKIFEIPFGVDTEIFKPDPDRPVNPLRFAFSGGISKRKGVDSLLRVWKSLNLKNAELHLYGRVRNDVKDELKDAQNVICHGHIPLSEELPKNHVFVFPSTLEGSAKSVYEALACGLAVITTPDSGSVVRDGIEGYIVGTGSDEELKQAMLSLYHDRTLLKEMAENSRNRALEYTWDRYSRSVWKAYKRILGND